MGLLLQTGNVTDMPKAPQGFNTCGNWAPAGSDLQGEAEPQFSGTSGGISKYSVLDWMLCMNAFVIMFLLKS